MKMVEVVVARIYITEASKLLKHILEYLQNDVKVRGVSVFRAISGFGETGEHTSSLVDLSLNLPLVIEFFDSSEKVMPALEHLDTLVKAEHVVYWVAQANA